MSDPLYAIGDIHGDVAQLFTAHERVAEDAKAQGFAAYRVIHIGDLVDRRPNSKEVIDYLLAGHNAGKPWITLQGNHDRMMVLFLAHNHQDPCLRPDYTWLHHRLGGAITLASYGVQIEGVSEDQMRHEALGKVPSAHLEFLENLPLKFETDDLFFCHAGIFPNVPLAKQSEDDLLWVRKPFHDHIAPHPKLIIHGHTPVDTVTHYGNRINIDTGAAYGRELSTIVLDGTGIWQVTADGRTAVVPKD